MNPIRCFYHLSHSGDQSNVKKSKLFFLVLGVLIVVVVTIILWWFFRQKSVGNITLLVPEDEISEFQKTKTTLYEGTYITFSYPSDFVEKPDESPLKKPLLERVYLSRGTVDGKKIAVLVQAVDYPLEEYSSYRMRALDTTTYTKQKKLINGLTITFFSKNTAVYEVVAFIAKSGKVASIALSSPTQKEHLEAELISLLATFTWREDEVSEILEKNS